MPKSTPVKYRVRRLDDAALQFQFRPTRVVVTDPGEGVLPDGSYTKEVQRQDGYPTTARCRLALVPVSVAKRFVEVAKINKQIAEWVDPRIALTAKRDDLLRDLHDQMSHDGYGVIRDEEDGIHIGCRHLTNDEIIKLGKCLPA